MSWKDLPQENWRKCSVCGHWVKKDYVPQSYAGALYAQNKDGGCENTAADWHRALVNKKYLLWKLKNDNFPQSIIDELTREITDLESKIPQPSP